MKKNGGAREKRDQDAIDYIKANTEARKEALAVLELTAASEKQEKRLKLYISIEKHLIKILKY